jgi:UrcA family protein
MYAKTLLTTIAFIACTGLAGHALAGPTGSDPDRVVSVSVGVGDLNLAAEAGAATVLYRIHNAARSICGTAPDARDLGRTADDRDCMTAAIAPAVACLNSPLVTALYAGRASQPATVLTASR